MAAFSAALFMGLVVASNSQMMDSECEAAISTFHGNASKDCAADGGACSVGCNASLHSVLTACHGRYISNPNEGDNLTLFRPGAFVVDITSSLVVASECWDMLVGEVIDINGASCVDAADLVSYGGCQNSSQPCSEVCEHVMQLLFTDCTGCEQHDGATILQAVQLALPTLWSTQCGAQLSTCAFGAGCTFDGTVPKVSSPVCDVANDPCLLAFFSAGTAVPTTCVAEDKGGCAPGCASLVEDLMLTCTGNNVTFDGGEEAPFKPAQIVIGLATQAGVAPVCQDTLVGLLLDSKPSCDEALTIYSAGLALWCSEEAVGKGAAECPSLCMEIFQTSLASCTPDFQFRFPEGNGTAVSAGALLATAPLAVAPVCQTSLENLLTTWAEPCDGALAVFRARALSSCSPDAVGEATVCPALCTDVFQLVFTSCTADYPHTIENVTAPLQTFLGLLKATGQIPAPCVGALNNCNFGTGCFDSKSTEAATVASTTAAAQGKTSAPTSAPSEATTAAPSVGETVITGSMDIEVADAEAFVNDPVAKQAATIAIAEVAGVPASYVELVIRIVTDGGSGRRLTTTGTVVLEYRVVIPQGVSAADPEESLKAADKSAYQTQLTNQLEAVASTHTVTVLSVEPPTVTQVTTSMSTEGVDASFSIRAASMTAMGVIPCLMVSL